MTGEGGKDIVQIGDWATNRLQEIFSGVEFSERPVTLTNLKSGDKRGCITIGGEPYSQTNAQGVNTLRYPKPTRTLIAFEVQKGFERGFRCTFAAKTFPKGGPIRWEKRSLIIDPKLNFDKAFTSSEALLPVPGTKRKEYLGEEHKIGRGKYAVVEKRGNRIATWRAADGSEMRILQFNLSSLSMGAIPIIGSDSGKGVKPVLEAGGDLYLGERGPLLPISPEGERVLNESLGKDRSDERIQKTWQKP